MRLAPLLAAGLLACQAGPASEESGADESSGDPGEPSPTPDFLNPAIGSFTVLANQTEPETFVVQDIVPGVTQVLFDGYSLGVLAPGDPVGSLTADALSLNLHGALTVGTHTIQLITESAIGPLYSVELEMKVVPPDPLLRPVWSAELAPEPAAAGDILFTSGVGASGLLGLISRTETDPDLHLYRAEAAGWSTAEPIYMPLEGHVLQDMSFGPCVSAVAFPGPDGGPPLRVRVAYNVGLPAARIDTRDVQIDPGAIVLDPVTAFDLADVFGERTLEWAAFGRPVAIGNTLIAALHAAPDAEQPHPGDHRLIASFWRDEELGWTPPQQIGTMTPSDLDSLGPAPVLADIPNHTVDTLSVRVGGAFPAVLELQDTGAISLTAPPLTAPLDVRGDIALATVLGNLGSRTVAAVDTHGRVSLSMLETSRGNGALVASPARKDLPDTPATGPLAPGVARGYPFFLVAYGAAAPVHVIASDGEAGFVQAIADLHCDAVALAVTLAGNDPDDAAVPLACLAGGELRLGRVHIDPPTAP